MLRRELSYSLKMGSGACLYNEDIVFFHLKRRMATVDTENLLEKLL